MLARVVNDDTGHLTPRGVLGCIVGTPPGACSLLQRTIFAETLIRGQPRTCRSEHAREGRLR